MDVIAIKADGTFDSGPVAITTAATWQEVCRLTLRGRRVLAAIQVGPQTIGNIKISQGVIVDDANDVDMAIGTAINSPALSNLAYVVPAVALPLAVNSVTQVKLQGEAAEVTFWAQAAAAAGGTVRVYGSVFGTVEASGN